MTGRATPSPQSQKGFSLNDIMQKGEVVPFNQSRKDKTAQRPPRKEVDLEDLRKALEESLAKKDNEDYKPKNSKEELKERIEEEKIEDETLFSDKDK
jgi:hypothetical protein